MCAPNKLVYIRGRRTTPSGPERSLFEVLDQHDIAVVALHVNIEQPRFIARYRKGTGAGGNESAHRGYPDDSPGGEIKEPDSRIFAEPLVIRNEEDPRSAQRPLPVVSGPR